MDKIYIGIDNGSTASIGVLGFSSGPVFSKPPIIKCQNYHKNGNKITRLDYNRFHCWLSGMSAAAHLEEKEMMCVLEKPYTGIATTAILAGRFYEAQIIAIESLKIPYVTIAASDWQGTKKIPGMLPYCTAKGDTKLESETLGIKLFPMLTKEITKHGDADGLLIAYWAKVKKL